MRAFLTNFAILLIIAALAVLTWLGQQKPDDPYLLAIQKRGTLRIALDPTYPPFDTLVDGKPSGYDVALGNAIAADLGVTPEYHTLALDTLYDALISEQVDVLISALPFIYERQKEVRYSIPYYQSGQVIVVDADNTDIRTTEDLAGRRVAVELGSNGDTEARRLSRVISPTLTLLSTYHTSDEALHAVADGEAEAAITDNLSAQTYLTTYPRTLAIVAAPITNDPYTVVMPVTADALADRINASIERLRASGDLAKMMGTDAAAP